MLIYNFTDYRRALRGAVEARRSEDPSFSFAKLADAIRVQHPYLSKVLNGNADLNADQLHLASEALDIDGKERKYLALLLEYARSALPDRRQELMAEITHAQQEALHTRRFLTYREVVPAKEGLLDYYLSPLNQIVHVSLSIERYRKKPALLADDLGFAQEMITETLNRLEEMGVIAREKGGIRILIGSIHLPKESPVFLAYRDQMRILTLQRLHQLPTKDMANFSMIVSMDEETKGWLHNRFLQLLKEAEKRLVDAPAKQTYQLNFDLFRWTQS